MLIVLFTVAIGCVMVWIRYKEYRGYKETVDNALSNKKFEKYDFSTYIRILYFIFILFGLISAGYGFYVTSYDTIAMGAIIVLLFISELLILPYKYILYYNDSHFIVKGTVLRYKSIKHFERITNFKFAFVKMIMLNGDKYSISPKSYEIINQHLLAIQHQRKK